MAKILRSFFTLFLFLATSFCKGQFSEEAKDAIEKYLENTETSSDFSQVLEDLTAYLEHPLRINSASLEELMNFPLLSPAEAMAIVEHRNRYGLFLHFHELQVLGFSREQLLMIAPFISVEKTNAQQWKDLIASSKDGDVLAMSTWKRKYPLNTSDSFIGDLNAQNIRIRYAFPGRYSLGFSADKDAGEPYWNKGPDFYSFHASVQNIGRIQSLVLGDYLLSFGQGLVVGSGIGMGKSALVMNVKRNSVNLKPYKGVNEFMFHRGAAVSLQFKKINALLAYSINSLDAKTGLDTSVFSGVSVNSIDLDGLHRNQEEILNKANNRRQMAGAWLQNVGKRGTIGAGGNYFLSEKEMVVSSDLYKQFYPSGKSLAFVSISQAHTFRNLHLFSEWAYCPSNETRSAIVGLLAAFGRNLEASFSWRHYDPGFVSPFSTAFGNNNQNETGFYAGVKIKVSSKISLSHYSDLYSSRWLTYRLYGQARGSDALWQLDMIPKKKVQLYFRFRVQNKPQSISESIPTKQIGQNHILSLRMHLSTPIDKNTSFQLRGENSQSEFEGRTWISSLFFAQFHRDWYRGKIKLTARYSLFDVPYYYNRIFAYENQLLYDFGTTAFYGKGYAFYAMLQQKINRHWNVGLRFSQSRSIQPLDLNNKRTEGIYLQVVYKS